MSVTGSGSGRRQKRKSFAGCFGLTERKREGGECVCRLSTTHTVLVWVERSVTVYILSPLLSLTCLSDNNLFFSPFFTIFADSSTLLYSELYCQKCSTKIGEYLQGGIFNLLGTIWIPQVKQFKFDCNFEYEILLISFENYVKRIL